MQEMPKRVGTKSQECFEKPQIDGPGQPWRGFLWLGPHSLSHHRELIMTDIVKNCQYMMII